MGRRSTDLLDIFRRPEEGPEEPRRAPAAKRPAAPRKMREPRADGPLLVLSRRQVVLGGSALALLLVLGFTLGLAAGRSGGREDPALARPAGPTARIYLQGRIDAMDAQTLKPVEPAAVLKELLARYGLPAEYVFVRRDGPALVIEVGPFPSRERAQAYARENKLDLITLNMSAPFRWPQFTER